jgi:hypothetical protein
VGDRYHHLFWGGVLRWAASDRPLMAGNDLVRFGAAQPSYAADEPVQIVVRLSEAAGRLDPSQPAAARILRLQEGKPEASVALVPLTARPAQPRVLQGQVSGLAPGQYAIELAIPALTDRLRASSSLPLRATFEVRPPESRERIDLATSWPLLEDLASRSGGKVFSADQVQEVLSLLAQQQTAERKGAAQPLWEWWVLLLLILGLLSAEWIGRKRAGLP